MELVIGYRMWEFKLRKLFFIKKKKRKKKKEKVMRKIHRPVESNQSFGGTKGKRLRVYPMGHRSSLVE